MKSSTSGTVTETADNVVHLDGALDRARAALGDGEIALPARFTYRWRGRNVAGSLDARDDAAVLRQAVKLCVLPYSAEDASRRARLARFLNDADATASGRFVLTAEQDVAFVVETPVELPLTGARLAVACVQGALGAIPQLDTFGP